MTIEERLRSSIAMLNEASIFYENEFRQSSGTGNAKVPMSPGEDIAISAYTGRRESGYHVHDCFFFDYALFGNHQVKLESEDNPWELLKEGEVNVGLPGVGHAVRMAEGQHESVLITVHVEKRFFFKYAMPFISNEASLFDFFVAPSSSGLKCGQFVAIPDCLDEFRSLMSLIVEEYAHKNNDTQIILRALMLSALVFLLRQDADDVKNASNGLIGEVCNYMEANLSTITLKELARRFSYHPNYISRLLKDRTGKSYSEMLLDMRMLKAGSLLRSSHLTTEEVALLLGYESPGNFYKAFKARYGVTPRKFASENDAPSAACLNLPDDNEGI